MKKINLKRFIPFILILLVIVIAIVMVVNSNIGNNGESSGDFNLDGTKKNTDSNTIAISQSETSSVNEYVDASGNKLDDGTLKKNKDNIIVAFKQIPAEKLGLNIDLNSAKIMFNQGTTTIKDKQFLVFNVYSQAGKNVGTYAMSIDTEVVYKYNTNTLEYELIEK